MNEAWNSGIISRADTTSIAIRIAKASGAREKFGRAESCRRAHEQEIAVVLVPRDEALVGLDEQRIARLERHVAELALEPRALARDRDDRRAVQAAEIRLAHGVPDHRRARAQDDLDQPALAVLQVELVGLVLGDGDARACAAVR